MDSSTPNPTLARLELLANARNNPSLQQLHKELCSRNITYFINNFVWTYDPRLMAEGKRADVPFILYPYQEFFIQEWMKDIRNGEDFLITKSRDMGATWMIVLLFVWLWMYQPGANFHIGSRKESEVDDAQTDPAKTIFGKIRYVLDKLPPWLCSKKDYTSKLLSITNRNNGNLISGESANSSFGRGGRSTAVLFDELAFWEADEAAWASAGQTTNCRIALSTPYGETNKYGKLALDEKNILIEYPGAAELYKAKLGAA